MSGGKHLKAGTRLKQFKIESRLKRDGFGVTYLARDCFLDREVTIKEYFPLEWAARGPDGRVGPRSATHARDYKWGLKRFCKEARDLARLRHAHIVQVHHGFKARGTAYIVTEYVEGQSLAKELSEKEPWSDDRVLDLFDGLIAGLEEVHKKGLVHRDVKPANVILRSDGSPVLINFGAARQEVGERSRSLKVILTPGYAPIEQYSTNRRKHGPWTDIYALGALAYKALSGRVPPGANERKEEDSLRPVSEVASQPVSAQLSSAVMSALALRREDRPQSLAAWRKLLPPTVPDSRQRGQEPPWRPWRLRLAVASAVALAVAGLTWWIAVVPEIPETFRDDCDGCPEMVVIPAGGFEMGSPTSEEGRRDAEGPQHQVTLKSFALGVTEVTFDQWEACVRGGGCDGYRPGDGDWGQGSLPVINVRWENAQAYVSWLSAETEEEYRLPSESEWEYAARAGTTTPFHTGGTISTDQANYDGRRVYGSGLLGMYREQTTPVKTFARNAFGLYDMHGNVWEWVEDCWRDGYRGAPSDGTVWAVSGNCARRVLRGGSWIDGPRFSRSASRFSLAPEHWYDGAGFRVAKTLD